MRPARLSVLVLALAAAAGLSTSAAATPAHHVAATKKIVVRPVTTSGHVAAGFTRKDDNHPGDSVSCSFDGGKGDASTVAVDKGIFYCSPDAFYGLACWKASLPHHVLCFDSAFRKQVIRIRGNAPTHYKAPAKPYNALNLLLANGERCFARDGGAASTQKYHPSWIETYFCGTEGDAVWSPDHLGATEGTNRTHPQWTVYVGPADGHLVKRGVDKAYFVGNA